MARPRKNPETAAKPEKTPAQKPEKVEELFLEFEGEQWNISDCKERAIAAYVAEGHRVSGIHKLTVYLKPEERKAYYVVNDKATGSVDL